jgi:hypothetical protein
MMRFQVHWSREVRATREAILEAWRRPETWAERCPTLVESARVLERESADVFTVEERLRSRRLGLMSLRARTVIWEPERVEREFLDGPLAGTRRHTLLAPTSGGCHVATVFEIHIPPDMLARYGGEQEVATAIQAVEERWHREVVEAATGAMLD